MEGEEVIFRQDGESEDGMEAGARRAPAAEINPNRICSSVTIPIALQ